MITAGGGSERGVTYRIGVEVDKASLEAIERFKKTVRGANEEHSNGAAKATAEVGRHHARLASDLSRVYDRFHREQERAQERAAAAAERAGRVSAAAANQLQRSIYGVTQSIHDVTRGFVLLGLSSEKDIEKALRAFAKFEGAFQILEGTLRLVRAGEIAWRAYATAVAAAAAAQAGAGVAGAAGAGGSAGGAAAGGLLGGLLARGIGLAGTGAAAIASSPFTIPALIAGSAASAAYEGYRGSQGRMGPVARGFYWLGVNAPGQAREGTPFRQLADSEAGLERMTGKGGYLEREAAASAAAGERYKAEFDARETIASFRGDIADRRAGLGLEGAARHNAITDSRQSRASAAFSAAQAEIDRVNQHGWQPSGSENYDSVIGANTQKMIDASRTMLGLEQQRMEVNKEALAAVKSELSSLKSQYRSEADRFLDMKPGERAAAIAAAQKAQRGEDLTLKEAQRLNPFSTFKDQVDATIMREATAGGGDILFGTLRADIASKTKAMQDIQDLMKKSAETSAERMHEFEVYLLQQADKLADGLEAAMEKFVETAVSRIEQAARKDTPATQAGEAN